MVVFALWEHALAHHKPVEARATGNSWDVDAFWATTDPRLARNVRQCDAGKFFLDFPEGLLIGNLIRLFRIFALRFVSPTLLEGVIAI